MISLGSRAHDIGEGSFEKMMRIGKEHGINNIQLVLKKSFKEFLVSNEALTPGLAAYIKKIMDANEIEVSILGCYLNLATPNEQELKKSLDTYKAHLLFAKWLGAAAVGTETGAVNEEYVFCEENRSEKAYEIFKKNLRTVLDDAERIGTIVAVELVASHIIYSPERARRLLDDMKSPNLKIILDFANLFDAQNFHKQEEILQSAFELLKDDVIAVHLKDYVIEDGIRREVDAGDGLLPYDRIKEWLQEYKPYIHGITEGTPPNRLEKIKSIFEIN